MSKYPVMVYDKHGKCHGSITCIENDVDLQKLKKPVMEALKANETA